MSMEKNLECKEKTMEDLVQTYRTISNNLYNTKYSYLGADYGCASALLEKEEDINHAIGLLRRNLDRGGGYWESDIRNRTFQRIADTIERRVNT